MFQEVIVKGVDRPPDCQAFFLHCALFALSLRQFPANVQDRVIDPPLPARKKRPPALCSRQDKREGKVKSVEQQLPAEGLFHPHKHRMGFLCPLDQIWGTLLGEVSQGNLPVAFD